MKQCRKTDTFDINRIIGKRIRDLREDSDLRQPRVAKDLGYSSHGIISDWENGKGGINTENIIKLADYFGVTCDFLMRGYEPEYVAVGRDLGLSQKAVDALKLLLKQHRNRSAYEDGHQPSGSKVRFLKPSLSILDCVNLLLEQTLPLPNEKKDKRGSVLLALRLYLSTEVARNTLFSIPNSPMPLRGSDLYAARLVDIQQSAVYLKDRLDSAKGVK